MSTPTDNGVFVIKKKFDRLGSTTSTTFYFYTPPL